MFFWGRKEKIITEAEIILQITDNNCHYSEKDRLINHFFEQNYERWREMFKKKVRNGKHQKIEKTAQEDIFQKSIAIFLDKMRAGKITKSLDAYLVGIFYHKIAAHFNENKKNVMMRLDDFDNFETIEVDTELYDIWTAEILHIIESGQMLESCYRLFKQIFQDSETHLLKGMRSTEWAAYHAKALNLTIASFHTNKSNCIQKLKNYLFSQNYEK